MSRSHRRMTACVMTLVALLSGCMDSSLSQTGEAPTGISVQNVPTHIDEVSIAISAPGMSTVETTIDEGAVVLEVPVGRELAFEAEAGGYYARRVQDVPMQGGHIALRLNNLIYNGDAERGPAASSFTDETRQRPSGWTDEIGEMWIRTYESNELGTGSNIGSGDNHFHGGDDSSDSNISQEIDLSVYSSHVDSGDTYYRLSGLLGGYRGQTDTAELLVEFLDAGGTVLGSDLIGPVTPADRNDDTDLRQRVSWGQVPASTRSARAVLIANHSEGGNNDGYADELSLTLHSNRP